MRKSVALIAFLILCLPLLRAQALYYTAEDSLRVEACLEAMRKCPESLAGERLLYAASFFLGSPYVASTLEREPEGLVVNLQGLDCTTLVEISLALVLSAADSCVIPSFRSYCAALRRIRYRNGEIAYTQRLHYISDWKEANERQGIVKDITAELPGSKPLPLSLSFISTHPLSYPQLVKHPEWISAIKQSEEEASVRVYAYIPKENLPQAESFICGGDILAFVTSIPGLDVSHLGIACWRNGKLTFLHASSSAKQVIVNPVSLQTYLERMGKVKGLWVIRVL